MKILIVVAHPDDEVLGMGGTIKKLSTSGNEIKTIFLSTGILARRVIQTKSSDKIYTEKFLEQDKKNEIFFENTGNQNYVFDLRGFINKEILNLNIKNIENIEKDTFSNVEFFYSYRRSSLNQEQDYGRCISVILMT